MKFRWFSSSCPCDAAAKAWLENRLDWLIHRFPSNVFIDRELVLPTRDFFPLPYDGSQQHAVRLVEDLCDLVGVDPSRLSIEFHAHPSDFHLVNADGDDIPQAAGTYTSTRGRPTISLDRDEILDHDHLVATIAHELSHHRLAMVGHDPGAAYDDELLTDLTGLFLGFGVFLANSPRVWTSQFTTWPGTDLVKPEYMTPPLYGYALAHLALQQAGARPSWARFLGPHATSDFKQALRYLTSGGLTAFRPPARARPMTGKRTAPFKGTSKDNVLLFRPSERNPRPNR